MRRSLMLVAILLQACDPPAPPAKQGTAPPAPSGPPTGILRIVRTGKSAAEVMSDPKPTPGFPSLVLRLEYAGPNTRLVVHHQGWHKGKSTGSGRSHQMIHLPVADDAAFGFSDGTNPEGKPVPAVHVSLPVESRKPGSGNFSRTGDTQQYGVPPLQGRSIRVHEPAWPLEIADGAEAVFWAVFVDEPADAPAGASLEERAKRADTAWIFKIRTADEKK